MTNSPNSRPKPTSYEQYEGYEVTVLPSVPREEVVKQEPYLAFTGGLGSKPSSGFGPAHVPQTNSIDPATGKNIRTVRAPAAVVSLGAKMPGVPGDIHSSKSGR